LTASDHKTITVKLKSPLRDELTPVVEVYGIADGNGALNCINYATFESSCYDNFGLLIKILSFMPKLFIIYFFVYKFI